MNSENLPIQWQEDIFQDYVFYILVPGASVHFKIELWNFIKITT